MDSCQQQKPEKTVKEKQLLINYAWEKPLIRAQAHDIPGKKLIKSKHVRNFKVGKSTMIERAKRWYDCEVKII
jgi:hypothetical protein